MSKEEKRIFRCLFVVNFLITLGFGMADPFLPIYARGQGAAGLYLGLIFAGYGLAKTVMCPVVGRWSDRIGRRSLLMTGIGTYSGIAVCYLFMPGGLALLFLKFVQGVAAALFRPVSLALVGDMVPVNRQGAIMGKFDLSFYGALAASSFLGGVIKDKAGFTGIFLGVAILCMIALVMAVWFLRGPEVGKKGAGSMKVDLTVVGKNRILLGLCGFIFTRSFGIVLLAIFLPVFMNDVLRLKGVEIGIVLSLSTVLTALLLVPLGRLSDRVRRDRLVIISGFTTAILMFCLPLAGSFVQMLLLAGGMGISSALSIPASSALLVEEGGIRGMGLTMGVFNGAMHLGAVLAPLAGSLVLQSFGMSTLFHSAGFIAAFGIVFFMLCVFSNESARGGLFGLICVGNTKEG
jgi:MFS transporter, DHA1 family, multidrug resistance protein